MDYRNDRDWTDKIHLIALNTIYKDLDWHVIEDENDELREYKDNTDGIDYTVENSAGDIMLVQERFRRISSYNDFTIRFEREYSRYETQKLSEFYKIKDKILRDHKHNFYLLYGTSSNETTFDKYVVVNLKALYRLIDNNDIVIDREIKLMKTIDGKVHAGVNYNHDYSSSFLVFDVGLMSKFDGVIVTQYGFTL